MKVGLILTLFSIFILFAHLYTYSQGSPEQVALSFSITNVTCTGLSNGSVDLTVSGGTSPYYYMWSNGQTDEDIINLTSGMYVVTVTDSNSDTYTDSAAVTQPAILLNPVLSTAYTNCSAIITVNVTGGITPYLYLWSTGDSSNNITVTSSGNYHVTVTDYNGCSNVQTANIPYNALNVTASLSYINTSCFGECNGTILVTPTLGNPPYLYSKYGPSGPFVPSALFPGLCASVYQISISDSHGCIASYPVIISQPSAISIVSSVCNVTCYGESNGSIDNTITGGTPPYSYFWSNGSTEQDLNNLITGSYYITVIDTKLCQATQYFEITQPSDSLQITIQSTNASCFGYNNGIVEITVSGGISPYYFLWSNQQTSQNIDSIEAGFYITSVTDSNGCTRTASASVNQPDSLSLTITTDDIECYGSDWGSADAFMMGGVMPYQFIWSNGDTTNVLTGLNAGYYYLTATDLNNCIITGTAIIGSPDSLIITAYVANPSCYGYNNGLIDLSGSGGTTPYFYTWSDSTTTEDACFLSSGSYSVTISDQNGCLITAGYNLIQPPLLTGDISPKNPLCSGLESGLAEVSVMGGTTPYCFIWSDGQETAVASSLHAGIYTLTVTDIMGCIFLDTINITQPDEVTIVQEITPATCILFSDGSISISVSGGTSPYSISWQDNQPDISIAGLSAGEYYVTVTDANSCVLTAVFEVTNLYPECFRIPNVFTPNGDSVNDTWVIDGMDLFPSAIVKVFDRWNRIVFQSSGNYIPWDGKYRGTDCPVDAYYFIIDFHANIQPVTGKLSIIR